MFIFDMYTATGLVLYANPICHLPSWALLFENRYVSVLAGLCSFVLYLPCLFVEHKVILGQPPEQQKPKEIEENVKPFKKMPREFVKQFSVVSKVFDSSILEEPKLESGE